MTNEQNTSGNASTKAAQNPKTSESTSNFTRKSTSEPMSESTTTTASHSARNSVSHDATKIAAAVNESKNAINSAAARTEHSEEFAARKDYVEGLAKREAARKIAQQEQNRAAQAQASAAQAQSSRTGAQAQGSGTQVKQSTMFEYGYRKKNYAPDELITDAHGNPITVSDTMLTAIEASKRVTHTPHLCFYEPRIPGNTGSAIRLCAVTGSILHLIEPLGFDLKDTKLRRAGLDYHDMAHVVIHPSFEAMVEAMPDSRIIAFTAHAEKTYTDVQYKPTDILLFGPEPGDIPDPMDVFFGPHVTEQVKLPMRPSLRSLNLTNTASIALYEAWRQLDFSGAGEVEQL